MHKSKTVTTTEHFEWDSVAEDWKPVAKTVEEKEIDNTPSILPSPWPQHPGYVPWWQRHHHLPYTVTWNSENTHNID